MKVRNLITLAAIILFVCVFVYFGLTGFSIGLSKVDPLPEQINLGLDLTGGVYAVYEAEQGDLEADIFAAKVSTTMGVLRKRLDKKGFTEATVVGQGTNRVRVEVPINDTSEIKDPSEVLALIGEPAFLEFKNADGDTILTGDMVSKAAAAVSQETGEYYVSLEFNSQGADLFGQLTKEAYDSGQAIDMTVDGEVISSATVEDGAIYGGNAMITGGATPFTEQEVTDLAIQIESGALPLVLHEIEVRSISASLGENALTKSIFAGFIGICLLFLFMLVYYRLPGLIACIALAIYMFIIILLLAAVPAIQLTLPGIAGIILGIGMAVDSNVIIFERFKEELAAGKTLRSSLNSGFSKALRTILDSNITTIIAAIVIAAFGVGTVKSFGYTLIISIITSMFTALVITRALLKLIMNFNIKNKKLYTIRKSDAELAARGGE